MRIERGGEWYCWVGTCIPKSLSNYPAVYTIHCIPPLCIFSRFNPCRGVGGQLHWASCCQQPTVTALSAVPLIIAQRSPCVEPNRGVQGVSRAKTSEESPLKDNKKTADWLQTTQRGDPCFSHEYKCDIDRKSFPGERKEKTAEETEQEKGSENEREEDWTLWFVSHR